MSELIFFIKIVMVPLLKLTLILLSSVCISSKIKLTINVPVVFMARYVMILRGATSLRGALEGVGPENRDFFGHERSLVIKGEENGDKSLSIVGTVAFLILHFNPYYQQCCGSGSAWIWIVFSA
jgi:hypothetical protein